MLQRRGGHITFYLMKKTHIGQCKTRIQLRRLCFIQELLSLGLMHLVIVLSMANSAFGLL